MEHLTKEKLEIECRRISSIVQSENFKSKDSLSEENHKKMYSFLVGVNYGVYLLNKYIERGVSQPYEKFLKEEIENVKKEVGITEMPDHPSCLRLSPKSYFFINEKPVPEEIYLVLEEMDIETAGGVREYLNTINPNLTVCPKCHVDDFTHVESCEFYQRWKSKDDE